MLQRPYSPRKGRAPAEGRVSPAGPSPGFRSLDLLISPFFFSSFSSSLLGANSEDPATCHGMRLLLGQGQHKAAPGGPPRRMRAQDGWMEDRRRISPRLPSIEFSYEENFPCCRQPFVEAPLLLGLVPATEHARARNRALQPAQPTVRDR